MILAWSEGQFLKEKGTQIGCLFFELGEIEVVYGSSFSKKIGLFSRLFFGTEFVFELVEVVVKFFDGNEIGGLLALHGSDDDVVAKYELLNIFGSFGVDRGGLETLGQEVVQNLVLNSLRVRLLVVDPASELVGVLGRVLLELNDGLGRLFNRYPIGVYGVDDVVIVIDATRDLAVSPNIGS